MSELPSAAAAAVSPSPKPAADAFRIAFHPVAQRARLLDDPHVLAVFGFGQTPAPHPDPRWLQVPLATLGTPWLEAWHSPHRVARGIDGPLRWADDGERLFASIEPDESDGDLATTVSRSYAALAAHAAARGFPHTLRTWNYLDAITLGEGDQERYRRFCIGRAAGLARAGGARALPAATCIGRHDGQRRLQLAVLASRNPGRALENPRQVSAWRYPRQYGPQSPGFARAMLPPDGAPMPLMLSGTAAIVGHASQHPGSIRAQLDETLANLGSVIEAARRHAPGLPATLGADSPLRVYVHDPAAAATVATRLDECLDPSVPRLLLHAQVCRRELLVEIEGVHGPATA